MTDDRVLGLIPARGGSKGIPRKNVREFAGDPLIAHTIRAALNADTVDRTLVSSDDEEIMSTAREYGADVPFKRPAELATDDAPTGPVVEHALHYLEDEAGESYGTVVLLQPTSPLRMASHVDEAVARYRETDATSLVTTSEDHSYRWRETAHGAERMNYRGDRKRRQDKSPEYVENGAIYIVRADEFMTTGDLQAGVTALYVMDQIHSIDVDEQFDLWLAENVYTEWLDR
jgi:N-acylneuraminate cytidylyltransferase/CMP-N,N'-diacetyllegionaminic acid synthase